MTKNIKTMNTITLNVDNIKCHGCANTIKKEIGKLNGVENVEVNPVDGTVKISYESRKNIRDVFLKKLRKLGYPEKGSGTRLNKAKSYVSCAIGRFDK